MMVSFKKKMFLAAVLFLGIGLLLTVASNSRNSMAQGPGQPTPTTGPPPTSAPTATNVPAPTGIPDQRDSVSGPAIAHIELHVQPTLAGNWSVVQWQDTAGNWHDVEGWRGSLATNGVQRWAVEQKDFDTGPFRWVVLSGPTGPETGASDSFDLPAAANELLLVTAAIQ